MAKYRRFYITHTQVDMLKLALKILIEQIYNTTSRDSQHTINMYLTQAETLLNDLKDYDWIKKEPLE
ncbi:MAG: hypothetical protein RR423_09170 [Hydrogenoanaerobacterium sp.]